MISKFSVYFSTVLLKSLHILSRIFSKWFQNSTSYTDYYQNISKMRRIISYFLSKFFWNIFKKFSVSQIFAKCFQNLFQISHPAIFYHERSGLQLGTSTIGDLVSIPILPHISSFMTCPRTSMKSQFWAFFGRLGRLLLPLHRIGVHFTAE